MEVICSKYPLSHKSPRPSTSPANVPSRILLFFFQISCVQQRTVPLKSYHPLTRQELHLPRGVLGTYFSKYVVLGKGTSCFSKYPTYRRPLHVLGPCISNKGNRDCMFRKCHTEPSCYSA